MNSALSLGEIRTLKSLLAVALLALCGIAFLGCFDIENPKDGVTFQHRAKIHFSINATSPSNVKWTTTYTDENGQSKTLDIGQGGSFDYDGLPIVKGQITKHLIQAKRGSDHKEVTIYIKPWCMYPEANCSGLNTNCFEGYCDIVSDTCQQKQHPDETYCQTSAECSIGKCKSGVCVDEPIENGTACETTAIACAGSPQCINGKCISTDFTCSQVDGKVSIQNNNQYCNWFCGVLSAYAIPALDKDKCYYDCHISKSDILNLSYECIKKHLESESTSELSECQTSNVCGLLCDWLSSDGGCGPTMFDPSKKAACMSHCNDPAEGLKGCYLTSFITNSCRIAYKCSVSRGWNNPTSSKYDNPTEIIIEGTLSGMDNQIAELESAIANKISVKFPNLPSQQKYSFLKSVGLETPHPSPDDMETSAITPPPIDVNGQNIDFDEILKKAKAMSVTKSMEYSIWNHYFSQYNMALNAPIEGASGVITTFNSTKKYYGRISVYEVDSFSQSNSSESKIAALNAIGHDVAAASKISQYAFFRVANKKGKMFVITDLYYKNDSNRNKRYLFDVENNTLSNTAILYPKDASAQKDLNAYIFSGEYYHNQTAELVKLSSLYYQPDAINDKINYYLAYNPNSLYDPTTNKNADFIIEQENDGVPKPLVLSVDNNLQTLNTNIIVTTNLNVNVEGILNPNKHFEPLSEHGCKASENFPTCPPPCMYENSAYTNTLKILDLSSNQIVGSYEEQPKINGELNIRYQEDIQKLMLQLSGLTAYYDVNKWSNKIKGWHTIAPLGDLRVVLNAEGSANYVDNANTINLPYCSQINYTTYECEIEICSPPIPITLPMVDTFASVSPALNHVTLYHELGHWYEYKMWAPLDSKGGRLTALVSPYTDDTLMNRLTSPDFDALIENGLFEYLAYSITRHPTMDGYGSQTSIYKYYPDYDNDCSNDLSRRFFGMAPRGGCNKNGVNYTRFYQTNKDPLYESFACSDPQWCGKPSDPRIIPKACSQASSPSNVFSRYPKECGSEIKTVLDSYQEYITRYRCSQLQDKEACDPAYSSMFYEPYIKDYYINFIRGSMSETNAAAEMTALTKCLTNYNTYSHSNIIAGALWDASSQSIWWKWLTPGLSLATFDKTEPMDDFQDFLWTMAESVKQFCDNSATGTLDNIILCLLRTDLNHLDMAFAKFHGLNRWQSKAGTQVCGIPPIVTTGQTHWKTDAPLEFEFIRWGEPDAQIKIEISSDKEALYDSSKRRAGTNYWTLEAKTNALTSDFFSFMNYQKGYGKASITNAQWTQMVNSGSKKLFYRASFSSSQTGCTYSIYSDENNNPHQIDLL